MAADHERLIRAFLRPSEELAGILYITTLPKDTRDTNIPRHLRPIQFDPPWKYSGQLLIALVKHYSDTQDSEDSCLLFLDLVSTSGAIKAVDALPIIERADVTFAQNTPSPFRSPWIKEEKGFLKQAPWYVVVKRDTQDPKYLLFVARGENDNFLNFIEEYRRLREIATNLPGNGDFTWIESYFSNPSSRCLDLRLHNKPLYRRLSHAVAGSPGDDILDISVVRRNWIERISAQRASTGIFHHLKIRLGTFNVNGKSPSQDLSSWLRGFESKSQIKNGWISPLKLSPFEVSIDPLRADLGGENIPNYTTAMQTFEDPDMFVLGFQELDQSTEALLYATSSLKEDEWSTAIFASLGEKGVLYEKLVSRQLVGMLLVVIVKKTLVSFTNIRTCHAASGILGFMGNKGATAIRLEFAPKATTSEIIYQPTILTFVNAHLAASDDMVDSRNLHYADLSKRLQFPGDDMNPYHYNIFESDVLFWIGGKRLIVTRAMELTFGADLNYRLELPDGDIRTLLLSHGSGIDNIGTLLAFDQLKAAIRNHDAFVGFVEPPITHFPTYRLGLGATTVKDQLGYDLKRKPAWTDRVLYMAPPSVQVTPLAYRNHPEITMSDHFPVSADFDVSWNLIDQSQREKSVIELHHELAGFEESNCMPKIKVKPSSVELGSVKYKQPVRREVVLQNEGDIPSVFRFVGSDTDPRPVPSWLRVEPMAGIIRPNESVVIMLTAYVDEKSAAILNIEPKRIECILILHTILGKDDFLFVTGDYEYTCFGNKLERLTRLTGPIKQLKSEDEPLPVQELMPPPEVLTRLTDWMMSNTTGEPFYELFDCPADENLCQIIRECLDTGDAFPEVKPDGDYRGLATAIANTLVTLLDSLTEPVIPAFLHARCLGARDKDRAYQVMNEFPQESIDVWIWLMAFLHFLTQQPRNGDANVNLNSAGPTIAYKLATIFAPILLRDDGTGVVPRSSPIGKRDFVLLFIE